MGSDVPAKLQAGMYSAPVGTQAGDFRKVAAQGCCQQTALPIVRGEVNLIPGTYFHVLLHFTNEYVSREVSTVNALAKLSKYLISAPLEFFALL